MNCIFYSLMNRLIKAGDDNERQYWAIAVIAGSVTFVFFCAIRCLELSGLRSSITQRNPTLFVACYAVVFVVLFLRYVWNDRWRDELEDYRSDKRTKSCNYAYYWLLVPFLSWILLTALASI